MLFCLASGAAFGAMAVFGKLAYAEGATVGTLLAIRFLLASGLFWLGGAARRMPSARDMAIGLGLGAGGYALQAGCYFAALERIDASLRFVLGLGTVDAFIIGFESTEQVDDLIGRTEKALESARKRA